jgi:hypothetical protein
MATKSAPLPMATANRAGLLDADPVFQSLPDTPGHPDVIDEDAVSDAHAGEPVWLIGTNSLDVAILRSRPVLWAGNIWPKRRLLAN